jgi:hypothetical protein
MRGGRTYHIHRFEGLTDGRPSWMKVWWAKTREEALLIVEDMKKKTPLREFRVRLSPRRR